MTSNDTPFKGILDMVLGEDETHCKLQKYVFVTWPIPALFLLVNRSSAAILITTSELVTAYSWVTEIWIENEWSLSLLLVMLLLMFIHFV